MKRTLETVERIAGASMPMPKRVLLVEDNDAVAAGLSALLELEGTDVYVVRFGSEAVPAMERFDPDLVILDVGLPDMSGTEVFRLLRTRNASLPVLFSTGHTRILDRESLEGPTAHLLKPYDSSTLLATLRMLMRDPRRGAV
jgi:DNA-binding response OmpR family regulator